MMRVDKPALLISGEWDPVTSPRWTRVAADQFSRSQIVIVPKKGTSSIDLTPVSER
jgi:pimeloyl-ACP methyl ester carboxylesterase